MTQDTTLKNKIAIQEAQIKAVEEGMTAMIKYRKGYPTKKSIYQLIEDCPCDVMHLYCNQLYPSPPLLTWQCKLTQNNILKFKHWAEQEHGLIFSEYSPYVSPRVGHLYLKEKN